ncbi:hypothetical protein [Kitasatospora sp. NPDC050543]|uniref:hypothetical protein n=1 Tax=Kitasatospora sp. NPDC050543 TaxID=3364054 RepID=UPI003793F9BE
MTKRFRRFLPAVALLLATGLLTGCSTLSSPTTVSVFDARQELDALMDYTVGAVNPKLEWASDPYSMAEDKDDLTGKEPGTVTVYTARHLKTIVGPSKAEELFSAVEKRLREKDYRPERTARSLTVTQGRIYFNLENHQDGFGVRVEYGPAADPHNSTVFDPATPVVEQAVMSRGTVTDPYWSH